MDASMQPDEAGLPPEPAWPALHRAAWRGDHDVIRRLVAEGRAIDAPFDIGSGLGRVSIHATPLMIAAGSEGGATVETVSLLIGLGADPTRVLDGCSAAMFAAAGYSRRTRGGGDAQRLSLLLAAGSPLPESPLGVATLVARTAHAGAVDSVAILLDHGCSPRAYFSEELGRQRAEHVRQWRFETRFVGAELVEVTKVTTEAMGVDLDQLGREILEEHVRRVAAGPHALEIPLFCAAESGSLECVLLLLGAGASVGERDMDGSTALFYARSPAIVRELASRGIEPTVVNASGDDALDALLEHLEGPESVVDSGTIDIAKELIKLGVPIFRLDRFERSRLYNAGFARSLARIELLLQLGHPRAPERDGKTVLHAVCWNDDHGEVDSPDDWHTRLLNRLLDLGFDPRSQDEQGDTPLHEAVTGDGTYRAAIRVLLLRGADVNAQNREGQTPLLLLYEEQFDYALVVPMLLEAGANPLIPDLRGQTALDAARSRLAGEEPRRRLEKHAAEGGPRCGWKAAAVPGDPEWRMLERMEMAASRFGA